MTERSEKRVALWLPIFLTIIALSGGIFAWASKVEAQQVIAPVVNRITALETHRDNDKDRVKRIEDKVDRVEGKIDRILGKLNHRRDEEK